MSETAHALQVYTAPMLPVSNGANFGDNLSFAADLMLDDSYHLAPEAAPLRLGLHALENGHFRIATDTQTGREGATVVLDSCITLMDTQSQPIEVLLLVEVDEAGHVAQVYAMPLAPLEPKSDYRLVGIDTENAPLRFAQVACVSFTRGTRLSLATGEQRAVEDLRVGDKLLTRDDGPQPIRWIGHHTVRAMGDFAPVMITKGTLHNENDLLVSPDHRLFVYQREDKLGAGRSEVLLKAQHLVNGNTVFVQEGGFVDYFQILFDAHQIVFAEGIAAETLLIDPRTRSALPANVAETLGGTLTGHRTRSHSEFEVSQSLLNRPDAAELLLRASRGS
ncbi:Hint domain-containing protein [Lentibacter sp. XHP0401]|uniref:Hint domain-containing protein n=1 Tax=Lentibacter sp. XHP0401 TaxID=2984334 RepID=UPI0021E867F9|nr:Hint domain-containing protein [Lentibacter sp. XHP0401]MCV2893919.1 Hint domain-containing protein [Lentibacter sp. XHP0401]